MQQCIKILLFHVYMEPQRVSGDAPPIIRSLKLHCTLSFIIRGRLLDVWLVDNVYQPHGQQYYRCAGLTTLPPSCVDCLELWEPQPPGTVWACPGL
jgi:hypothetical protein